MAPCWAVSSFPHSQTPQPVLSLTVRPHNLFFPSQPDPTTCSFPHSSEESISFPFPHSSAPRSAPSLPA